MESLYGRKFPKSKELINEIYIKESKRNLKEFENEAVEGRKTSVIQIKWKNSEGV